MAEELAFLREEVARKQRELAQLQREFDEYTESSHELEQELEQELTRAETQNGQLQSRNQVVEHDLLTAREKLDHALAQVRTSEYELKALQTELAQCVDAKRKLEQEQDDLHTQVRILQATEEDLHHRMEREMEEKVFLLDDQEELQREHELATERFRTEIVDLKSELFVLRQKYDKVKAVYEANRNNQAGYDSEDDIFGQRPSLVTDRDVIDREVQIETMQQEIEVLSARIQDETETREKLEIELIEMQMTVAQAEAMEAEVTEMTDELIEKAQEIRKRDMEIQTLQETVAELKMKISDLEEQNAEFAQSCEQLREDVREKIAAMDRVKDELDEVQAKCYELVANESILASRLENEVQLVAELREQIDTLLKDLEESENQRADLVEQVRIDQVEIEKCQKDVEELQELNSALQLQLEQASRQAVELEQATALSTTSTASSCDSAPIEPQERKSSDETAESKRLALEVQSLRAKIEAMGAENSRLRGVQEGPSNELLPSRRMSAAVLKVNYSADELARKYLEERARNASLLSRLQTVCGNIQVFCRVRPVIDEELEKSLGSKLSVKVINHSDIASMDIKADRVFGDKQANGSEVNPSVIETLESNASWKVFTFDRILGPEDTQIDVFREVEPIAQSVVDGFKACIFAYGQTGSGKTFTMEGTESNPGVNYRVISHIFQSILLRGSIYNPAQDDIRSDHMSVDDDTEMTEEPEVNGGICYHVQVGVLEIYNDTLHDLVDANSSKSLDIRHNAATGDITVADLTMTTVSSPEETIAVLRKAQTNRVTGKTESNAHSSRSHSVVMVQISTQNGDDADNDEVCGKLYLVDLAGSERVKKSNVSGDMLREAAHINKSLSALADVMEALDKKLAHVPYRNSKLTFLLQDVLNSSCKTVMIVNVGPTFESANETYRSLQLAERVRNIVVGRNSIVKNKKDILSAKKAFSEIQSLKSQMQLSMRKFKQSQQTVAAMVRGSFRAAADDIRHSFAERRRGSSACAVETRAQEPVREPSPGPTEPY